jgi:alpha-D-ribose 1-methylphosphonate 5-triphosphate diphosphatase PhnM
MKVMGKLGMALGVAVGYVLGARAGRERYEQIAASARQIMDKPQVKRVVESAPETAQARVEQLANKAADAVHQAADRVAPHDDDSAEPPAAGSSQPAAGRTTKGRSKSP